MNEAWWCVIVIDDESDVPGIRNAYGPYSTPEEAERIRGIVRDHFPGDPELVQVTRVVT